MLLQYAVNGFILVLLITFALSYQMKRNNELNGSRFELAGALLDAKGMSNAEFGKDIQAIDDFLSTFKGIIEAYYTLPLSGTGSFMHYAIDKHNATAVPPILEITYYHECYEKSKCSKTLRNSFLLLEEDPLGPFAHPESLINGSEACEPRRDMDGSYYVPCRLSPIGQLFDHLIGVKLTFSLYSLVRQPDGSPIPRVWLASFLFALTGHSSVMTMKASLECIDRHVPERLPVMISCTLFPLVIFGFLVRIRTFPRFSASVSEMFGTQQGCLDGVRMFPSRFHRDEGGWRWLGFLSDAFVLAFSIAAIVSQFCPKTISNLELTVTILLGFSILISCIRLVSILRLFPSCYIIIDSIVTAGRQLAMYSVAVFFILFGYAICGHVVFGTFGGYFGTLPRAIVTLFCTTFGDNIIDTFLVIDQSTCMLQIVFARIFFGTFILLFICTVLNVAHSIIQDSYTYTVRMYSSSRREGGRTQYNAVGVSAEELAGFLEKLRK
ncbi:uncharacterized protein Tco025E_08236 [Trypanosoma conorhini]|uniref:Polycystin cation channel PKD1/PKD2 domain-containing protein n=1 Tax=Trypanosoma conorhini TaxID=83891 RepID=A0A3R7KYC9_9TRYP|nr:uncharacterized protein Tco025E_08236 [Trypanosoma conorhini]RNF03792.1 hypothetical protein Tco025E_08236 [Trypanosoma conorhini]